MENKRDFVKSVDEKYEITEKRGKKCDREKSKLQ